MGKIARKYGTVVSHALFEVGNSFNLSKVIRPDFDKLNISFSPREALGKDWNSVGKGVELAFGRFEETIEKR